VGGTQIDYGTGGANKTTLAIDQCVHLAAGVPWLGLLEPARPLRILLVEVEGPRQEFRRKLRRRLESWTEPEIECLKILSEPWAKVTLRSEHHRSEVARLIREHEIDLVVIGPLRTIGMKGGGTLDEIEEFMALVEDVRERAEHDVAFRIIHHDNRAGQISGAWEGVPDVLVHVQPQGQGHVRIFWQKVKWASALHQATTHLTWADGDSFAIEDKPEITEETIAEELEARVREKGGQTWTDLRGQIKGNDREKASVRDRLVAKGVLVNTAKRDDQFNLWHPDDPALTDRAESSTEFGTVA
jgi:hypothetical protein